MRLLAAALAAAMALSAADGLVRLNAVPESKIVHKVQPRYPPDARDARIEGVVRVSVLIGKNGHVQDVQLISGHPLLAPAALQAARRWVFEPFQTEGKPVRATTILEFPFTLSAGQ